MQVFFFGSVELDVCSACQGIWFDSRELARVSGRQPHLEPWGPSTRDCPICAFRMTRGELQGVVEAERCDGCEGYFLDKGELAILAGFDVRPTRGPISPPLPAASPSSPTASRPTAAAVIPAAAPEQAAPPPAPTAEDASSPSDQDASEDTFDFWGETRAPQQTGFECVVCNQRHPMTEGNYYRGGLACRACAPQAHITAGERAGASGTWVEHDWAAQQRRPTLSLRSFLEVLSGNSTRRW